MTFLHLGWLFFVKVSLFIYMHFLILMDIFFFFPFNSFWYHHIFLKFDIFYLDIRFLFVILYPSCIYLLFYAYLCLLGAVTCVFLANNLAIFCRGNTSGYIGVCNNDKINSMRSKNLPDFAYVLNWKEPLIWVQN